MREVIVRWVRQTGLKAVICPEMVYQLDDMDELLFNPLPDDVKPHVVRRTTFWITDEATSLCRHARAVVSMKLHAPVLAIGHGVPALHIRQQEDTHNGQMYRDIGLADWLYEIDASDGADVAETLLGIHHDHAAARSRLAETRSRISASQAEMIDAIRRRLAAG